MSEFPTDWHRDAYLANLQREITAAQLRQQEFADDERVVAAAKVSESNARAELDRVTGVEKTAKKPARKAS